MTNIHYEPHPVTPARKAELLAKGLRIIDAKFVPASIEKPEKTSVPSSPEDIDNLKKPELIELLKAHNCEVDPKSKVPGLKEALKSVMFIGA